jgi:predicted anti-sigma-YlaC factor YlaD
VTSGPIRRLEGVNPASPPAAPPHGRIRQLLAAALDGPLDPVDRAEVSRHLRECVDCRIAGSGYAGDASQLRDIAAVAAPDWIAVVVLESAARPRPHRVRSRLWIHLRLIAAVVGAILVIAVLVVLVQALR